MFGIRAGAKQSVVIASPNLATAATDIITLTGMFGAIAILGRVYAATSADVITIGGGAFIGPNGGVCGGINPYVYQVAGASQGANGRYFFIHNAISNNFSNWADVFPFYLPGYKVQASIANAAAGASFDFWPIYPCMLPMSPSIAKDGTLTSPTSNPFQPQP